MTNLLEHARFLFKTHLLEICLASDQKIYCFFYDEITGTTGPREVIFLLDYLIQRLQNELERYDQLIIWSDKAPGQFKDCFLFFYLDYNVWAGQFLHADFKFLFFIFLLQFGTMQRLFKKREIIAIPRQWEEHNLSNVEVCWVTLAMIKDFKSFLRLRYLSPNKGIEEQRFEVKNIARLNCSYREEVDDNEELELVHHPEGIFVRFQINPKAVPWKISFLKKEQVTDLRQELLTTLRKKRKQVRKDVKCFCILLAQKYLSVNAVRFYKSLPSTHELDVNYGNTVGKEIILQKNASSSMLRAINVINKDTLFVNFQRNLKFMQSRKSSRTLKKTQLKNLMTTCICTMSNSRGELNLVYLLQTRPLNGINTVLS